jgi:hypothetical protein
VYRYRCLYEKRGDIRFVSHIETINVIQRALRRTGWPLRFTRGYHPHPRISAGPSLAVGMEGLEEFFDVELTEPAEVTPDRFEGLLPDGFTVKRCVGPFSRSAGRLPPGAILRYELDCACFTRAAGGDGTRGGADAEMQWRLLMDELTAGHAADTFTSSGDTAGYIFERLGRLFTDAATILDRRGRIRSCDRCSIERGEDACRFILSLPSGEGNGPTPGDLLQHILPTPLAKIVRVKRLEILYKKGDSYLNPIRVLESCG